MSWILARKLKSDAKPIRIEVVSLDWKWLFIYPDQEVAAVNELVVPIGTPVEFMLTSATVMNAFFVPQLGSQIYTMPGMTTHLNLHGRHSRRLPGPVLKFQRRWLLGHAVRGARRVRGGIRELAGAHARRGPDAECDSLCAAGAGRAMRPCKPTAASIPMLFEHIVQTSAQPLAAPLPED